MDAVTAGQGAADRDAADPDGTAAGRDAAAVNPADAVRTLALLVQALAAAVQERQALLQLELPPLVQQAQA